MQTIAITIDAPTLKALDRLRSRGGQKARRRSRSELIREAVHKFVSDRQRAETDARDAEILRKHSRHYNAMARWLLKHQAPLP